MTGVPLALAGGATALPYATLWLTRSGRLRERARRLARTGWHRRAAGASVALALYTLASSAGGSPLPAPPIEVAWAVVTLSLAVYAHVDLLVAAGTMRAYPDGGELHYDLASPRTWPATSARIVSAWGWLVGERHPWLAPAFLALSLSFGLGAALVPWLGWVALSADCLVLGVCCLPWPADRRVAAAFGRAVGTSTG
jgi:hypothetical protein